MNESPVADPRAVVEDSGFTDEPIPLVQDHRFDVPDFTVIETAGLSRDLDRAPPRLLREGSGQQLRPARHDADARAGLASHHLALLRSTDVSCWARKRPRRPRQNRADPRRRRRPRRARARPPAAPRVRRGGGLPVARAHRRRLDRAHLKPGPAGHPRGTPHGAARAQPPRHVARPRGVLPDASSPPARGDRGRLLAARLGIARLPAVRHGDRCERIHGGATTSRRWCSRSIESARTGSVLLAALAVLDLPRHLFEALTKVTAAARRDRRHARRATPRPRGRGRRRHRTAPGAVWSYPESGRSAPRAGQGSSRSPSRPRPRHRRGAFPRGSRTRTGRGCGTRRPSARRGVFGRERVWRTGILVPRVGREPQLSALVVRRPGGRSAAQIDAQMVPPGRSRTGASCPWRRHGGADRGGRPGRDGVGRRGRTTGWGGGERPRSKTTHRCAPVQPS